MHIIMKKAKILVSRTDERDSESYVLFTGGVVVIAAERGAVTFAVSTVASLVARTRTTLVCATRCALTTVDLLMVNKSHIPYTFHRTHMPFYGPFSTFTWVSRCSHEG